MDTKKLIEEVLLALGNNKSLTDVSSKIQIIVRLLGDKKLKSWYTCEFVTGYKDKELPDYRISRAVEIKANYIVPQGFGAWKLSGQSVPVRQLRCTDCKYVPRGTPVQHPPCREAIHGLRDYRRNLQASDQGQSRTEYQ